MKVAHIGLPKCASTYLQKHYFSGLSIPFCSTQTGFHWPDDLNWVYSTNALWYGDLLGETELWPRKEREHRFQQESGKLMPQWGAATRRFAGQHTEEAILLSSEGLAGLALPVAALHAELLKQAGIGRIMLIVRRQNDYAVSLWRQFLLAEDRFARFIDFPRVFCEPEIGQSIVDMDWCALADMLDGVFGVKNVLVVPYEQLVHSPQAFFERCAAFFELGENAYAPPNRRENPSRSDQVYWGIKGDWSTPLSKMHRVRILLHRLARRFPEAANKLRVVKPHSMSVPQEILDGLMAACRESNQRLARRIGMDLQQYGYY